MDKATKRYINENGIESCGRFYGTYIGVVRDWRDPLRANRLLVNVPEVYGDNAVTRIALPNFGIMGKGYGTQFIPDANGIVTVTFRQGDPDYPYWSPGPWADEERPEEFTRPTIFGFKSRTGHIVAIDDDEEHNYILLHHKDGYFIEIKEGKMTVGGDVRVEIKDNGINIGKKDDMEPAVLGNALKGWLEDLILQLTKLQTVDAKNMNPENIQGFIDHGLDLDKILAKFPS